jgi:hypothetical protein
VLSKEKMVNNKYIKSLVHLHTLLFIVQDYYYYFIFYFLFLFFCKCSASSYICLLFTFVDTINDMTTVESLQFDFATIEAATNKFTDDNKLGQGGFGAVYKVINISNLINSYIYIYIYIYI